MTISQLKKEINSLKRCKVSLVDKPNMKLYLFVSRNKKMDEK